MHSASDPLSRRSFLRHASLSFGWGVLGGGTAGLSIAEAPLKEFAKDALPRSNPALEGVSASGILDFLDALEQAKFELHSFMMLRHGKVIAEGWWEPYGPDIVHTMYSMSKSFTSMAVGFAVAEGKMSLEDQVISFFPEELPEKVSDHLSAMRVKHLLSMATGNEKEPTGTVTKEENWVRIFLAQNFAHAPGSVFMYNSAATYMCSAIVQKVTGQTILEYLKPRLFTPLGITGMRWESCPRGINTGGWGLSIQSEGLAKFGQWLLQKGQWQGKQLLPAAWIEEATKFHIQQPGEDKPDRPKANNDWLQGYGYQFWRCQGTEGIYRGDGAFGQFTIVLPKQDAVIVMTSENKNMQGQLDLVWKHLLPAFDAAGMPPDGSEPVLALGKKLQALKLVPPLGASASPAAGRVQGKSFKLEPNELGFTEASIHFQDAGCSFQLKVADQAHRVECSFNGWSKSEAAIPGTPPRLLAGGKSKTVPMSKIAASATWSDPDTLMLTLRYYETPHSDVITCRFDSDGLTLSFLNSITAMNPKAKDARAALKGRMA